MYTQQSNDSLREVKILTPYWTHDFFNFPHRHFFPTLLNQQLISFSSYIEFAAWTIQLHFTHTPPKQIHHTATHKNV